MSDNPPSTDYGVAASPAAQEEAGQGEPATATPAFNDAAADQRLTTQFNEVAGDSSGDNTGTSRAIAGEGVPAGAESAASTGDRPSLVEDSSTSNDDPPPGGTGDNAANPSPKRTGPTPPEWPIEGIPPKGPGTEPQRPTPEPTNPGSRPKGPKGPGM